MTCVRVQISYNHFRSFILWSQSGISCDFPAICVSNAPIPNYQDERHPEQSNILYQMTCVRVQISYKRYKAFMFWSQSGIFCNLFAICVSNAPIKNYQDERHPE